jgi:uncharacterized membrane protein
MRSGSTEWMRNGSMIVRGDMGRVSLMQDVHEVHALGDGRLRWRGQLGSRKREWESEVDEDRTGARVAWRSIAGAQNDAEVTLMAGRDGTTSVQLRLVYDDEGAIEGTAAAAKAARARVEHDLRAFKQYAERKHAGRKQAEGER